jgi:hypothetical protein
MTWVAGILAMAHPGEQHATIGVVMLAALGLFSSPGHACAQQAQSIGTNASKQASLKGFEGTKASGGSTDATKQDDRGLVLLPVIVSDPLLGVGLGAAGMYSFVLGDSPDARGSYISASALVTTNRQIKFALTHNIDVSDDHFVFRGRVWIKLFTEGYWGVGNDTPDSDRRTLDYDSIDYLGRLNVATKFEHWFVGPLIRINFTWNTKLEQPYPPPKLAGDELDSFLMMGVGLSLVYDSRDGLTNPYKGFYAALELIDLPSGFPKTSDTTVGVIAATADVRGYHKPFPKLDQIFAWRAYADLSWGRVPFSMLATPGRDEKLRGHLDGRLRDYDMAGVDVEYRVRFWGPLGSTVFASWAALFGAPGDRITWNTMPKSAGVGLRYMVQETDRVNLRLDLGFNFKGDTAVIFECGEAF